MSTETTEQNRALEQAKSQASGIVDMVRALDRETAAEDYAETLNFEECNRILELASSQRESDAMITANDPDGLLSEMRDEVASLLENEEVDDDEAGFEFDEEAAREVIMEDPLSVQVRSGWASSKEEFEAEEFEILLCTGGPAVRIRGELDGGEPSRAWIEYQDWYTPWTQLFDGIEQDTLLTYCRQFYFGE